jgi:uncharacterized cupin superfamily protein
MKIEVRKPTEEEKKLAESWPIWEKEVSEFPWKYDTQETCLILEGEASVSANDGSESATFSAGDWVVFSPGLECTWRVTSPVKKRYKFG